MLEGLDLIYSYNGGMYRFYIAWSCVVPLGGCNDFINEISIALYNRLKMTFGPKYRASRDFILPGSTRRTL